MDERVAEAFTAPGDEVERLMYGYSLLCCLPMVWPTSRRRDWAQRSGRRRCALRDRGRLRGDARSSDIEHQLFRFYRLR